VLFLSFAKQLALFLTFLKFQLPLLPEYEADKNYLFDAFSEAYLFDLLCCSFIIIFIAV
jgi:hypothetical protein